MLCCRLKGVPALAETRSARPEDLPSRATPRFRPQRCLPVCVGRLWDAPTGIPPQAAALVRRPDYVPSPVAVLSPRLEAGIPRLRSKRDRCFLKAHSAALEIKAPVHSSPRVVEVVIGSVNVDDRPPTSGRSLPAETSWLIMCTRPKASSRRLPASIGRCSRRRLPPRRAPRPGTTNFWPARWSSPGGEI
jgi:hypothetical protein